MGSAAEDRAELRRLLKESHRRTRPHRWRRKAQAADRALTRVWAWCKEWWPALWAVAFALVAIVTAVTDG